MSNTPKFADSIPGFLDVALLFNGTTPSEKQASIAWLKDGDTDVVLDLAEGLKTDNDKLTRRMRSYLGGMLEVGDYLKARHKDDEDDVTEDDIERAALLLAFPKVGRDEAALKMLKSHLDAFQKHKIIETLSFAPGKGKAAATSEKTDGEGASLRAKVDAPEAAPMTPPQVGTRMGPQPTGAPGNA